MLGLGKSYFQKIHLSQKRDSKYLQKPEHYGKTNKMEYNKGTVFSLLLHNHLYKYRMRKT